MPSFKSQNVLDIGLIVECMIGIILLSNLSSVVVWLYMMTKSC